MTKKLQNKYKKISIYKTDNIAGKGVVISFARKLIETSHIIVHDADLEYEPTDIQNLKELSIQNPKSLILGSRNLGNISRKKRYKYLVIGNKLITKFFSSDHFKSKKFNLISSIAMFYDLPDPIKFVEDIYDCLDKDGLWHLEQSYMPSMIKNIS